MMDKKICMSPAFVFSWYRLLRRTLVRYVLWSSLQAMIHRFVVGNHGVAIF
jgi:hypothetical protein